MSFWRRRTYVSRMEWFTLGKFEIFNSQCELVIIANDTYCPRYYIWMHYLRTFISDWYVELWFHYLNIIDCEKNRWKASPFVKVLINLYRTICWTYFLDTCLQKFSSLNIDEFGWIIINWGRMSDFMLILFKFTAPESNPFISISTHRIDMMKISLERWGVTLSNAQKNFHRNPLLKFWRTF